MSGFSRNGLLGLGAIIGFAGLLALAVPVFTTRENTEVVKIGDLKLTASEETSHSIPQIAAFGALLVGALVAGAAFAVRR